MAYVSHASLGHWNSINYPIPARGMEIMNETKEIKPPIKTPTITAIRTARILFQLNLLITKLENHPANSPARISPTPWQTSEIPIAVVPCLSLTPLSAIICIKTDRTAKMIRRTIVKTVEMIAGVLLGIIATDT